MDSKSMIKIIIILALAGMAIDALLTYNKITYSKIGCPAGGSCDIVISSPYSEFFGIPVSLYGMGAFIFFVFVGLLSLNGRIGEKMGLQIIAVFGAIGLVIAAWFIYLMEFVIQAICPWCILSHALLLAIFLVCIYALIKIRKA